MKKTMGSDVDSRQVKVFKARESLYDQLIRDNIHIRAVYRVWVIQSILLYTYVVLRDSFNAGRLYVDLSAFLGGLGSLRYIGWCVGLEVLQLGAACLIHPAFQMWVNLRSMAGGIASVIFTLLYITYVVASWYFVVATIFIGQFPPFLRLISTIEQMRLSMKSYSFIRENAYKVLYPWHKDDEEGPAVWYAGQMEPQVGSFSKYLYFLFSPTMLYRDNYPRNTGPINWLNAGAYFTQFLSTIFFALVIFKDFLFPESLRLDNLVHCFLCCLPFGLIELILAHTCLLHSWMNFGAELTRFADRQFYTDWWNVTNYASYYRRWNYVAHDWLVTYIYKDLKTVFHLKTTCVAMVPVLLLSSFIHDYQIAIGLGAYIPVLLCLFGGVGVMVYAVHPFERHEGVAQLFTMFFLAVGGAIIMWSCLVVVATTTYCPCEPTLTSFVFPNVLQCFQQHNY